MRKYFITQAALLSAVFVGISFPSARADGVGYRDTPMLPDQKWRVHDADRPVPHLVTPAPTFSHGAPPPSDAVVLFDGKDLSKWKCDKGEAGWKVVPDEPMACCQSEQAEPPPATGAELLMRHKKPAKTAPVKCCAAGGYMEVVKDSGSIRTKEEFGDFQLHLEFATPAKVVGDSQGRGNSGVIIYGRFEIQVMDSFENPTYPDGQCGAIYGQYPPLVNASKKPGEWQSYDIIFEGPRWDDAGKLTKKANVTVIHNGVLLHHKKEIIGEVRHKEVAHYDKPQPPHGPIMLQDHGNPVRYRNIWIRELGEYDKP